MLLSALSLTIPCALIVASPAAVEARPARSTLGQDLVVNGDFSAGKTGWRANGSSTSLSPRSTKQRGPSVAISGRTGDTVVLNDKLPTIQSTTAGTRAWVEAWVRAAGRTPLNGQLRVREVKDGRVITSETTFYLTDSTWTKISLDVKFETDGGSVDLNVLAWNLKNNQRLLVDRVSMRMVDEPVRPPTPDPTPVVPTPTPEPTPVVPTPVPEPTPVVPTPTPEPTPPAPIVTPPAPIVTPPSGGTLTNGCAYTKIGIPECGAYMGAAYGSNTDPSTIESTTYGRNLGVRRTYFGPTQVDSAVRIAGADLAKGRLPWISFKLPYSWADMAAGKGDAWARDLTAKLDKLNGPVWVAFHHEPEGDGPMQDWTAMQRRLSPIVKNNSDNVAFTIIVTGWHQLYGEAQYSLNNIWPGDGKVDVIGADIYQSYGLPKDGVPITKFTDLGKSYFAPFAAFAKAHGAAWGLGETGMTNEAFRDYPNWLKDTYNQVVDNGGVAFAYFDTVLNGAPGSNWDLGTVAERAAFKEALRYTPSLPKLG